MEPKRAKTIRFRFMRNIQGAGSPQKKVERINPAPLRAYSMRAVYKHSVTRRFNLLN
jgi:hypothetical protein